VYVLVEDPSSDDPLMAFRMLPYVTRIWDQHPRDDPRILQLPAVISLVVHHSSRRWTGPVQLADLITLDPAAGQAMGACLPLTAFVEHATPKCFESEIFISELNILTRKHMRA
jgi:hypothetical protein